jgi:hypothetical protein
MLDRAGATAPFAKAGTLLAELAGITLTTKRVERAAEADGTRAAAAQAEHARAILTGRLSPLPPAGPAPHKLYLAIDRTGVPMTPAETRGRAGNSEDGRARTREAKLAALFTQTRTDENGRPVRDPDSTSYLATLEPVDHFAELVQAEAHRRGAGHIRQLVVLGDGAHWIWNLATTRFPAATQIVDLFHAREHLYELADLLAFITPDPAAWLADRLAELDAGNIEALSAAARLYQLDGPKALAVAKAVTYFETNAQRKRYAYYRRLLPSPGNVRRLRRRRSRLQSSHRPATQALRHALEHPRRHRHHHPALPAHQRPLEPDLPATRLPDRHRLTDCRVRLKAAIGLHVLGISKSSFERVGRNLFRSTLQFRSVSGVRMHEAVAAL